MARIWVTTGWCVAALLPILAGAVSTSRQELVDALHSTPNVDRGAELFDTCAACHGTSGSGTRDGAVPRLAGQHYDYLVRQMHDAIEERRPNFSAPHVRLLARLQGDDMAAVADYLSRVVDPK